LSKNRQKLLKKDVESPVLILLTNSNTILSRFKNFKKCSYYVAAGFQPVV